MLINIVQELDMALERIRHSDEVVVFLPPKPHAVVDALGNLIAFTDTAGQYSKYPQVSNLSIRPMTVRVSSIHFTIRYVKQLFPPEGRTIIPIPLTGISIRERHLY